ncbi:MAG: extracellular solute-binding protein [Pseudolysinimonas sp.]
MASRVAIALSASLVAAAALAGCSTGASSGTSTVSFYSWDPAATMKPVIDGFEAANPSIKIQTTYGTPVQGYISALQTRLGSGTASDVFIITAENKQQIMDGGFAKDLSSEPFADNLASAAKDTYTKDGKLYGAAIASWGGGILYNKDLLAKVGYTTPPATWNDFLDLCKKLQDAGIAPFYEAPDGITVTLAALLGIENQKLGGTMDADIFAGKTTFAKTWTDALTTWDQLFTSGIEPSSVTGLTGDQVMAEFEKGNVAMTSTGSWALGGVQTAAPDLKLDFMAVAGAKSSYWAGAVSPGYAINAKSKNTAAAEKFVAYLQSPAGVELYQKATASITTTADFTPTLDPALSTMADAVRKGDFYLPQVSWPTHSADLNAEATAQIQEMVAGRATPAQVAAALDAKLKSLLG